MKFQWNLILGLSFAIIIAVFAIVNVNAVEVHYVFGQAEWPLVLIILCSALLGAAVSVLVSMFRSVRQNRQLKELHKQIDEKERTIATLSNKITELEKKSIPQEIKTEVAASSENEV